MKKQLLIFVAAVFGLFFMSSSADAGYLDPNQGWKNITAYDGLGIATENEDNEVEPGATTGQNWDMEGFYFNDGTDTVAADSLTMVGGFNFVNGEPDYPSGDIFIDIDGGDTLPTTLGDDYWEYILDLNFDESNPVNSSYTVYENTASTTINKTSGGPANTAGYAWTYGGGGALVSYNGANLENIGLKYLTYQTDTGDEGIGGGLTGGFHNKVTVDVSFLGPNTGFSAWSTMRCGNDRLFSDGTTSAAVPEPATIFLLGSGLLGLFGYRKKFRKTDK